MFGSSNHHLLEAAKARSFRIPGQGADRLKRFTDEITTEYLALQPQIAEARARLAEARALPISRAEVMRVMKLIVHDYVERDYGPIFKQRITDIWSDPEFDERYSFAIDPLLDQRGGGMGSALSDALYFLLPDLMLDALEKRVNEVVPKSAKGTLTEKRQKVADAEAHLAELTNRSSVLIGEYRTLLDDKLAIPGEPLPFSPESKEAEAATPK